MNFLPQCSGGLINETSDSIWDDSRLRPINQAWTAFCSPGDRGDSQAGSREAMRVLRSLSSQQVVGAERHSLLTTVGGLGSNGGLGESSWGPVFVTTHPYGNVTYSYAPAGLGQSRAFIPLWGRISELLGVPRLNP